MTVELSHDSGSVNENAHAAGTSQGAANPEICSGQVAPPRVRPACSPCPETRESHDDETSRRIVRFMEMFGGSPFPHLLVDASSMIFRANPAMERMLHFAPGSMTNIPLAALSPDDAKSRLFQSFRGLIENQYPHGVCLTFGTLNGTRKSVRCYMLTAQREENSVPYFILALQETEHPEAGSAMDPDAGPTESDGDWERQIARLKRQAEDKDRAEKILRRNQERLSMAFWGGHIAWWDWNLEEDRINYSPRIGDVLGSIVLEKHHAVKDLYAFIHPEDAQPLLRAYACHLKGRTPALEVQLRVRADNERWIWMLVRGRICERSFSGNPIRLVGIVQNITRLKQTTEERDFLFTHSRDMLAVLNFDGVFRQVNPAWESIMGWRASELVDTPVLDLTHPDHKQTGAALLAALRNGVLPPIFEQMARCRDGSYRWLSCAYAPLPGYAISVVIARDITHQKEMEMKLRELNQRLEQRVRERSLDLQSEMERHRSTAEMLRHHQVQLSEALAMGRMAYWEYDPSTDHFLLNDRCYDLWRTTADREGGYRLARPYIEERLLPSESRSILRRHIRQMLLPENRREGYSFEIPISFRDGALGHIHVRVRQILNASGDMVKIFGIGQDITERKKLEMEVLKKASRYQNLIENARDAVFIADADSGNLLDANRRGLQLIGRTKAQLRKMHYTQLHAPEQRENVEERFHNMLLFGQTEASYIKLMHRDGSFVYVELIAGVTSNDDRNVAFAVMRDMSKEADELEFLRDQGVQPFTHRAKRIPYAPPLATTLHIALTTILRTLHRLQKTSLDTSQQEYLQALFGTLGVLKAATDAFSAESCDTHD